jgi:hypothetical protein
VFSSLILSLSKDQKRNVLSPFDKLRMRVRLPFFMRTLGQRIHNVLPCLIDLLVKP